MKFIDDYKNVRLSDYDYHNGWFFITNKTNYSKPYLTKTIYNLVRNELETLHQKYTGVSLDYATIMPTHVHGILIFVDSEFTLSEVWRRFKARTTYYAKRDGLTDKSLWQRNYYEHIIRNERALDRIREYIRNNPIKEELELNEIYDG